MHLKLWLAALLTITARAGAAAPEPTAPILMTFWSDDTSRFVSSPMPGSLGDTGAGQDNAILRRQLDAINVLAYSFLQVDESGNVYFRRPQVDLASEDAQHFCQQRPLSCPNVAAAAAGSFSAFARLTNTSRTLRRIISIGGADSQRSLDSALAHPAIFVQSAAALIDAYSLDGIDLDFEPDAFFAPGQGEQYSQLVADLRTALGGRAFISIEVPSDSETLRSVDCPADTRCQPNLGRMAADAYVSLMGYEFHAPDYPGDITGNNSNLYSDPDEPLAPHFYHVSDNQAIEYLTSHSVPAGRILLGFPAYFVAYEGVGSGGRHGLYQPFDKTKIVPYDLAGSEGRGTYRMARSILQSRFRQRYVRVNGKISAAYAYSASAHQWISYDNPASVRAKADYVVAEHLGGMMMWEISEDAPVDDPKSLLRNAHAALFRLPVDH